MSVIPRGHIGLWVVLILCCGGIPSSLAGGEEGVVLQAQLVWATEGEKPSEKDYKQVDAVTRNKLRGVFRWREYYEIARKEFTVLAKEISRVRLSPKCEIEVERLARETFEVKLFGEGRMVVKKRQSLKPAELLVLAGDDKNDTAWFVVIRMKSEK